MSFNSYHKTIDTIHVLYCNSLDFNALVIRTAFRSFGFFKHQLLFGSNQYLGYQKLIIHALNIYIHVMH